MAFNMKFIVIIGLAIVALLIGTSLAGVGTIMPEPEVTEMPGVETPIDAYKYVQAHGELSKRTLAGAPINNYQVQVYHRAGYVFDSLPPQPLWAARGTQGNDIRIILTLTAPDGSHASQTVPYAYSDLPVFKSSPPVGSGVADVPIGGYFAVAGPGTYTIHMEGYENDPVEGWILMDDTTWQDDPYDTITVVVP